MSYIGKLGTVCMTGDFNKSTGVFTAAPNTKMGTVTRKSLLELCNIDDPDLLTSDLVRTNHSKLKSKLFTKVKQNLNALYNQLIYISNMSEGCKMFRVSSDLLPMFDHPILSEIYNNEMLSVVDLLLSRCKSIIDKHNIIVTTHPSQYTLVNSANIETRKQSYLTLQYHKYFMERLTIPNNSCINIHLEGNLDHLPELDQGLHSDLIPWLSFENSDKNGKIFTGSTENTLAICEKYKIKMVYDCHHHFVMTGEYLDTNSVTFKRILNTWNGHSPVFHVSQSRESDKVIRAHSDFIDDSKVVEQAKNLLMFGSVEVEAKAKTTAVVDLYNKISL